MTQAEIDALLEKVSKESIQKMEDFKAEFNTLLAEGLKDSAKKEEIQAKLDDLAGKITNELPEELKGLTAKEFKEMAEMVKTQGAEITALKEKAHIREVKEVKTLGQMVKNELLEQGYVEKNEELSAKYGRDVFSVKNRETASKTIAKLESKSAIDMTTTLTMAPGTYTNIGSLTSYTMRDRLLNVSMDTHMMDVFPVTPINDKYFGVVVEYTETDGVATTDENTGAGKSSFLLKTLEYKVFKINTYYHVSEENLEDVDQLVSKIDRRGVNNINSAIDEKILSTSGDGSTDILGLYKTDGTTYTAFTSVGVTKVKDANIVNLIGKMKLQANNTDDDVNIVILHPSDIDAIEQLKDADGNSLLDRSVKFDAMGNLISVKGLVVIRNKKQTTDTCCVMWSEAAEIGLRRGVEMIIGLDSDDLTTGMRTIVLSARVAFGPSKYSAVIYSSGITADVAAITEE